MNCQGCYTENRKGSKFCKGCGKQMNIKIPKPRPKEGLLVGRNEEFTGLVFTRGVLVFIFLILGGVYAITLFLQGHAPFAGIFLFVLGLLWMPKTSALIFPEKKYPKTILKMAATALILAAFWLSWSV